ncbi:MAG: amidohydrolase family protein [Clostridia bacterium]
MKQIKKIDIHAHVSLHMEYEFPEYFNNSIENQLAVYDTLDIEKGILLPLVSIEAQPQVIPNGDTCYLAKTHPDRFYWFCNVDPRAWKNSTTADLGRLLSFYKELGAKGMGELTANLYADDPMIDNLFAYCQELNLPVTIHIAPQQYGCYGIIDEVGLPRIDKILTKYPQLKILGHSQPFWAEISADVTQETRGTYPAGKVREGNLARLLRNHENLYCDMSAFSCCNAMTRDPEYAYRFIEEFGTRMMYAIDLCLPDDRQPKMLASFLDNAYADGYISEKSYYGICRGNAIRVLKLDDLTE